MWNVEAGLTSLDITEIKDLAIGLRVSPAAVLGLEDEDMKRRDLLKYGLGLTLGLSGGLDPTHPLLDGAARRLSPREVDDLVELTRQHALMYWGVLPATMDAVLADHHRRLTAALRTAAGAQRRQIHALASTAARLRGLAAYDMGDRAAAARRFEVAERLAAEAGDATALTLARINRRLVTTDVDAGGEADRVTSTRAIAVLEGAEAASSPEVPGPVRAWLYCSRAEENAALGNAEAAFADLDRAGTALATGAPAEGPQVDTERWGDTRLEGWRASVLLRLNQPRAAISILEQVVPATPTGMSGYRAAVEANLGAAYAQAGEVDHCVALQLTALQRARADGRQEGVERVRSIRRRYLGAYATSAGVRRLDEALAS